MKSINLFNHDIPKNTVLNEKEIFLTKNDKIDLIS